MNDDVQKLQELVGKAEVGWLVDITVGCLVKYVLWAGEKATG